MTLLHQQTFVCIDCETTGLDPQNDRVIEVAVAVFTLDQILESFDTLIDPQIIIPPSSIEIHHISDEMVAGKPKIEEVLEKVFGTISRYPIVGHQVQFDIDVLAASAARNNLPCNIKNNEVIDTLRLARRYGNSPNNSLQTLREHFNVEFEGPHRALSDVIVNIEVFKHLCKAYKTMEQIRDVLSKPISMKLMPLGKHKGRLFKDLPLQYLKWAARQDFDQDLTFSLRSELKKRQKGGGFQQEANPFKDIQL
jgi:DNA polymerase III subunit epsilon